MTSLGQGLAARVSRPRSACVPSLAFLGVVFVGALGIAACAETVIVTFDRCELDVVLNVESAGVGESMTMSGGPMTDLADTEVLVGGVSADVTAVERDDCTLCDECVAAAGCSPCGTCDACVDSCESCVESAVFVVPEVASGEQAVVLINAYGSTGSLPLEILGAPDTDTGAPADSGDSGETGATGETGDTDGADSDTTL